jgi:cardiolipin synthase
MVLSPSPQREQIFFNGSDYFESLLKDINVAQVSIDLEAYIFNIDKLGKRIIAALIGAARRGIKIRVMVDGAGSPQWGGNLVKSLEVAGAKTRVFHPFPWRLWQWSRSFVRVPSVLKAIYLLLKINSRNHRKACIIDKKIVYVGSFNISQSHLEKDQEGEGWRDTGIRLQGVNLEDVENAFNASWDHLTVPERLQTIFRHIYTNPIFRLNNTRHRRRILYKNLLRRMARCKKRIWITNAYFVPDNFLLKKLVDAAARGIDVRILLPKKSDVAFMPWASNAFYESLLRAGVRIFEYLPSILHAKTLILDDWMLIGSSNLNHRSLLHDFEVDVNIRLPESKDVLEQQFLFDLEHAKEIKLDNWQISNFYQRIIGKLLLYVKYMI